MLNVIIYYGISWKKRHSCFWNFISSIPRTDNNEIYTSCSLSVSSSVLYTLYKLSARTSLRRSSFNLDRISIWTESDHRKTRVHKPRSDSFHFIKWIIFLKKKMHKSNIWQKLCMHTCIFNEFINVRDIELLPTSTSNVTVDPFFPSRRIKTRWNVSYMHCL